MWALAGEHGVPPGEALDMTLFEWTHFLRGKAHGARLQMESRLQLAGFAAWATGGMSRGGKLPDLRKWLGSLKLSGDDAHAANNGAAVLRQARMQGVVRGLPAPKARKFA